MFLPTAEEVCGTADDAIVGGHKAMEARRSHRRISRTLRNFVRAPVGAGDRCTKGDNRDDCLVFAAAPSTVYWAGACAFAWVWAAGDRMAKSSQRVA